MRWKPWWKGSGGFIDATRVTTAMNNGDYTLLVVDDNEMNRDLLSRRLMRRGFKVEKAADGREALEMIESQPFDLILLDIMMPGVSGIEVLKILRDQYSTTELPIIMATAKDKSEDVVQALELGANDYVTKPIDFPVVLARVQSHLRSKKEVKQAPAPVSISPRDVRPGVVLANKYLLEDKLGAGSFGSVYRAKHLDLQHPVAVKVLETNMAPASEAFARFQREGISACRIKHPNAVSVLDFSVTDTGIAYLVMELLVGRSLAEELREKGTFPPWRCGEILTPICEVLAEAHAAGIVHRDIKPANIFLHQGKTGEIVKVLDFGIAKLVGEATGEEQLTVEGSLLGTPAYMAPERLSNRPYDGRADVYSLGIMLYQMLCGRPPFDSKDMMAVALQHVRDEPPPLRTLNPGVPPAVEAVVIGAMSKDPNERPGALGLAQRFGQAVGRRASDRGGEAVAPPSFESAPTEIIHPTPEQRDEMAGNSEQSDVEPPRPRGASPGSRSIPEAGSESSDSPDGDLPDSQDKLRR